MPESAATSYDVLPYESQFNPLSHPDRLAAMAALYGVEALAVARCRVLELGCGVGGNAIGIAQSLPDAEVVGVDLSPRQVAEGRAVVDELGLTNVALHAMSLTEIDDAFGRFDYLICHGVYSWVPVGVQAKILDIGARNLAPTGVFFLSYNVYPGWFQPGAVRAAMQFHTRGVADPRERVAHGRAFLDFLINATTPVNTPYALALKQEADLLKKVSDTYLFHEHMEEENRPAYFHELAARAAGAGLHYLAPARFSLLEASVAPDARAAIDGFASDRIGREQYFDYVLNRAFRQSLFCRADAGARPEPSAEGLAGVRLTALARPESPRPDLVSDAPEPFHTLSDDHVTLSLPRMKAAVVSLYERWPRSAGLEELRVETLNRIGGGAGTDAESDRLEFAGLVLQGMVSTLIESHRHEPAVAPEPGDRPRATPLARRQAATGAKVVTLRNNFAVVRDLDRLVLPILDGTRDRAAVVAALIDLTTRGDLRLHLEGQTVADPAAVRRLLEEQVDASFVRLAGEALFLSDGFR